MFEVISDTRPRTIREIQSDLQRCGVEVTLKEHGNSMIGNRFVAHVLELPLADSEDRVQLCFDAADSYIGATIWRRR